MKPVFFANMRLDRFLCELNIGTRSQVKELIKKGNVSVNGVIITKSDTNINETSDEVLFKGEKLRYREYVYIMINKPDGVVTATRDKNLPTVMDLIKPLPVKDMSPVGRLDRDTTGLLLITNDGELSHRLLSPKYHVDKTYLVTCEHSLSENDINRLCEGVDIGDDEPTLPARVKTSSGTDIFLTIHEGRFHQVKRMLEAVENKVTKLKRVSFGPLDLPGDLKEGEWRELTEDEIQKIIFK